MSFYDIYKLGVENCIKKLICFLFLILKWYKLIINKVFFILFFFKIVLIYY